MTLFRVILIVAILLISACSDSSDSISSTVGSMDSDSSTDSASTPADLTTDESLADNSSLPEVSEADQFLADNAARDNVTVTESGLQFEVLRASEGAKPSATSVITVHYVGERIDGTVFDSSIARGEPSTFNLGGTILGWIEGVQLMNVGSQYRFVIPPNLAYGERGSPPNIGPNAVLVFVVDLLEINTN